MHKTRRQAWQVILGYHIKSVLNGHSTQHVSPQAKIQGRGRVDEVDELTISNSADCSAAGCSHGEKEFAHCVRPSSTRRMLDAIFGISRFQVPTLT